VFENIFNIVMDMKWKKNDNIKIAMDISLFWYYKNIKLIYDGSLVTKPKASVIVDKNVQLFVYQ
jgi:hypothetical protein